MNQTLISVLACVGLLIGMVFLSIIGQQLSKIHSPDEKNPGGSGAVTAAMFALLGLLIAFTFTGAFSRFDNRRQLAVQQANAVGTAYLRVDLMPDATQNSMREKFRRYVNARLAIYGLATNLEAAYAQLDSIYTIQNEIWTQAVVASQNEEKVSRLLLPAINEMIDITTMQIVAFDIHPPPLVWIVLFSVSLICALFVGFDAGPLHPLSIFHIVGFAAIVAFVLYVILDVEYPQTGIIRLEYLKFLLEDLANQMRQVSY